MPNGAHSGDSEARYRDAIRWDRVASVTHCVDCYPEACPFKAYVAGGRVLREEQSGVFETVEAGVPDMNPAGCQKGAGWSRMLDTPERVLYPLLRDGERGSGRWRRASWDEALAVVADGILDALQGQGSDAVIYEGTPAQGGLLASPLVGALFAQLGAVQTDVNANINDFGPGLYLTFGKFNAMASADDWFHSELVIITCANPVYTWIAQYHFIAEARYKGAEVITVAPDCSPSTVHADEYVPVRPGCDAALALSICRTVIDEKLYNRDFVALQTDLPLLLRDDTRRYLRASDMVAGGSDLQLFWLDEATGRVVEAPRATLDVGNARPALEGAAQVTLADGSRVRVRPVFESLRDRLIEYDPERAVELCGAHPEQVRALARKIAVRRTNFLMGLTSGKYFHGDLIQRSWALVAALTGNWGRKGTGFHQWAVGGFDGAFLFGMKPAAGPEAARQVLAGRRGMIDFLRAQDPTLTEELAAIELSMRLAEGSGTSPSAFFWHRHGGYADRWRRWTDPSMKRPLDEYVREAEEAGWWPGARPAADVTPEVFVECGGNILRRARGGGALMLKHLWPKLKLAVTIDWRMSTTAMHSDVVLPAAQHYEKASFQMPMPRAMGITFSDRAVPPAGESKSEYEIMLALAKMLEERAGARGFSEFVDASGQARKIEGLHHVLSKGGAILTAEQVAEEMIADTVVAGNVPPDTTIDTMRARGFVRFLDWGISPYGLTQATDVRPDETTSPFRNHVERLQPYPTLSRRAQFYIEHPWFMEAGEELPCHKPPPNQGGAYPLTMISGHNRWSSHSTNQVNRLMLNTHRGHPFLFINPTDALVRGIADDCEVRVYNDAGRFVTHARVAPSVPPGLAVIYNGWEPYQFPRWEGTANVEPGLVKWLGFAGGYGHLRYWQFEWQPVPNDRAISVDVELATGRGSDPVEALL
jgi:DMSO reductase family type II enzyme molybdopterin subunit